MTIEIGSNDAFDTRPKSPRFDRPILVLVEGRDDQSLLEAIVGALGLEQVIETFEMRGKTDWVTKVQTIVTNTPLSSDIRALGLVRDADQDAGASWQSCIDALAATGFPQPIEHAEAKFVEPLASAVLIIPDLKSSGAIEELWLRAVEDSWIACIEQYFECLGEKSPGPKTSKNRVRAFLAGARRAPPTLGVAYRMGAVNRDHETFDGIKNFLSSLAAAVRLDVPEGGL